MRVAELDEAGTLRMLRKAALEGNGAHLVWLASGRSHTGFSYLFSRAFYRRSLALAKKNP
jgi:hypothetical protein